MAVKVPNGATNLTFTLVVSSDYDLSVGTVCNSWTYSSAAGGTTTDVVGPLSVGGSCYSGFTTYYAYVARYAGTGTWTLTVSWTNCETYCPSAITGTTTLGVGGTTTLSTSFTAGSGVTYSGTAPIVATRVFSASSTFTSVQAITAEVLVVAGGGGGGSRHGGGGGGGGVLYSSSLSVPAGTHNVTVGMGGMYGWYAQSAIYNGAQGAGDRGKNSAFGTLLTSIGGGGGRTYDGGDGSGGSGGGGSGTQSTGGGVGTGGQGNAGGTGSSNTASAGGGGGAGAVGGAVSPASGSANGGTGGNGVSNSITGSAVIYGGGGGGAGAVGNLGGNGGNGGGGHGGDNGTQTNQTSGTDGLGGGGGGDRSNAGTEPGSMGGSGIVIIKYTAGTWSTANPSVALVNSNTGVVTGVSAGTALITYTAVNGCSVSQMVTVSPTAVCPGGTMTLTAQLPTGGVISSTGTDRVHSFTSSGTFYTPSAMTNVRTLVIAGGGGGGSNGGGGGGAGGMLHSTTTSVSAGNTNVTIGGGGASAATSVVTGSSGGPSSFGGITAIGGGGGASRDGGGGGLTGGSGGGGGGGQTAAGSGTAGQGNAGRTGYDNGCPSTGGGGGGAGGLGTVGANNIAGNGGVGLSNDITGTALFYAGGGGGGTTNYIGCGGSTTAGTNGTGGNGGGGNGESSAGTANTGGGGGAERAGGSGVVIVRYSGGSWSTADASIATIGTVNIASGTAVINAISGGTTTITYTNAAGTAFPMSVTVNSNSVAPLGATGTTTICNGSSTALTVNGGTAGTGASTQWFTGSCGGTSAGTGNAISVSPTTNTTYYVRYAGTCNTTACGSVAVVVNQQSIAPTSITGTSTICTGSSTTLASSGGSLGTNAVDVWFAGSCNEVYDQSWNSQPFGVASTTINSISNGILNVTSTTNDPMIFMDALGSFDPAIYRYINIRYRVVSGTASNVELFFYNTSHAGAVGGETGFAGLISDGAWHTTTADMWSDPDYLTGGNITGWRYDWTTNSGVTMELDFISLSETAMIDAATSINISPTSNTTYYTKKKGICNNTSCTSQLVTVKPLPTVNVGSAMAGICQGGTSAALGGSVGGSATGGTWSTTAGGTFSPNANDLNATWTPPAAYSGTATLVLTSTGMSPCSSVQNSKTIVVAASPTVNVGGAMAAICQGGTSAALGGSYGGTATGATWSTPAGGTFNPNANDPNATWTPPAGYASTATLTLTATGTSPCAAAQLSKTIVVNPAPATFTVTPITTMPLCFRGTSQIQVPTTTLGLSYQLRDNTTNVGVAQAGGSTLTFMTNSLTTTNPNYNVLATNAFTCSTAVSAGNITVDVLPNTGYASNNDSRACYVNSSAYIEFKTANGMMVAINSNGQNLGNVTVTEYNNGSPLNIQACNTYQPWYRTATLARHWKIEPQFQPVSPVSIRTYFDNTEYSSLQTAANSNANPNDDIATLGSLDLTKYSNSNASVVNGSFADNCNNGGVAMVYTPSASGNIATLNDFSSFAGTGRYIQYNFSGFSEFWLSGTNNVSPLPIVLTSFTAACEDKGKVKLEWITATELNNEKFIVERSSNMETWEEIATVNGAGNSNVALSYAAIDERPINGLSYYRLKQSDYDGQSEIFEPISVTCYSSGNGNMMMVYPNPASERYLVSIFTNEEISNATLEIADLNGKRILLENINLVKGNNEFTYDASGVQPGAYIVRVLSFQSDLKPVKLIIR